MAPRRITDQSDVETAEAIDVDFSDRSEIEKDMRDEENEILSEFGEADGDAGMYFTVRKVIPGSKDKPYCFEGTRGDLPVTETIQRKFGAGKYEIWLFKNKKIYRRIPITVLAPIEQTKPDAPQSELAGVLKTVLEQQTAMLARMNEAKPQSSLNAKEMLTLAMPAITAFIPFLFKSRDGGSVAETMQLLATAKELFQNDGEQREKGLIDLATDILPPMFAAMSAQPPNGAQPKQLSPPQSTTPTPEQIQQAQMAQLQMLLRFMIGKAQKSSDPGLYAEVLVDTLPPEYVQMLCAPGAIEMLVQLEPAIATYRPWFDALLQALIDGPIDDDGEAANGDAQDTNVSEPSPASIDAAYRSGWRGGRAADAPRNDDENESGQGFGGDPG